MGQPISRLEVVQPLGSSSPFENFTPVALVAPYQPVLQSKLYYNQPGFYPPNRPPLQPIRYLPGATDCPDFRQSESPVVASDCQSTPRSCDQQPPVLLRRRCDVPPAPCDLENWKFVDRPAPNGFPRQGDGSVLVEESFAREKIEEMKQIIELRRFQQPQQQQPQQPQLQQPLQQQGYQFKQVNVARPAPQYVSSAPQTPQIIQVIPQVNTGPPQLVPTQQQQQSGTQPVVIYYNPSTGALTGQQQQGGVGALQAGSSFPQQQMAGFSQFPFTSGQVAGPFVLQQ